jgi:hypothetical protein
MRILIHSLITFIFLGGLCACNSTKYVIDYDKNINFTRYETYNFTPSADSIPLNQLKKKRLFNAISAEMNAADIRWDIEPDIYVHIHMLMKGKTRTNVTYGQGQTVNLGSGFTNTYVDLSEYSEGSLFFDIIDAKQKQLVWTGKVSGTIKDSDPLSEKDINKIVQRVFREFPPRPPR